MKKTIEKEEKEENQREFADQLDIIKSIQEVYNQTEKDLDENYPLSDLTPKEKDFIRQQHLIAKKIFNYIGGENPNREGFKKAKIFAIQAYDLIMTETKDLAILNRNTKTNPMLTGILKGFMGNNGGDTSLPKENKEIGPWGKVKKLLGKEKKVKEED